MHEECVCVVVTWRLVVVIVGVILTTSCYHIYVHNIYNISMMGVYFVSLYYWHG
mgnify:CR=1 FL=1